MSKPYTGGSTGINVSTSTYSAIKVLAIMENTFLKDMVEIMLKSYIQNNLTGAKKDLLENLLKTSQEPLKLSKSTTTSN